MASGNSFSVAGDGDITTGNIIDLIGSSSSWRLQNGGFYLDFRREGAFLATLDGSGQFGLGVFTPAEKLHVDGTIRSSDLAGVGTRSVRADSQGNLVAGEAVGIVSIGPAAFQGAFPFFERDWVATESQVAGKPLEPTPLIANVQLPQGANIIGVIFNYRDASTKDRIRMSLQRSQNVSAAVNFLAVFETPGAESPVRQEVVLIDPPAQVDTVFYYYYLRLVPEVDDGTVHQAGWDDMFVRSVQIYYTLQ
jgi:hypothetical protein